MPKVSIRYQQVKDARRFFDILTNPNFIYFRKNVKSVADQKKWLKKNPAKRKNNIEWNYTILYENKVVGGIGFKINQHRKHIGEIGYFIDEEYWGRGIAVKAVKLAEKEGFKKIGLSRIEVLMRPENKASEKVAIKSGYTKEGLLRKYVKDIKGKIHNVWLYAKTL
ncbi:MAG: GNAT family N-acetyltransferase [bacterium]|nr:GNAT family N-acetyltransferase [bacterium]